jgi:hypothetical protein
MIKFKYSWRVHGQTTWQKFNRVFDNITELADNIRNWIIVCYENGVIVDIAIETEQL